jgi:hypothetical protein
MARIGAAVAFNSDGLLLHGALAEYRGLGFLMAGPATIGKSTASRRLPPPWRSLSDDTTLVVRDRTGRFWAHPWPTWSVFSTDGKDASWEVEHAVPLDAIFFLGRSHDDRLERIESTQSAALVLDSMQELVRRVLMSPHDASSRNRCAAMVRAARALVAAVPVRRLELSPAGPFWELIERVLSGVQQGTVRKSATTAPRLRAAQCAPFDSPQTKSVADDDRRWIVYSARNIDALLGEPELLEVVPYGRRPIRVGDVVYFKSPGVGEPVVHRVSGRIPTGILTRGDLSRQMDPWVLEPGVILGRVISAQRGSRRRSVVGGACGSATAFMLRMGQAISRALGRLPGSLYNALARRGPLDRTLPAGLRPRLVRFEARRRAFMRLLIGRATIGWFDDWREEWRVRRPFRLFVDVRALPHPPRWSPPGIGHEPATHSIDVRETKPPQILANSRQ